MRQATACVTAAAATRRTAPVPRAWGGIVAAAAVLISSGAASGDDGTSRPATRWVVSFSATPQAMDGPGLPDTFRVTPATVRQVARASLGGRRWRVVLSNAGGTAPVQLREARIALVSAAQAAAPGPDVPVTFSGEVSTVLPAGASLVSDAVDMAVPDLSRVAVSLVVEDPLALRSGHVDARQTAWWTAGSKAREVDPSPSVTSGRRVLLSDLLVEDEEAAGTLVVLGDSLSDGAGATTDADRRWPDRLAERLVAAGIRMGVSNAGVSGARLLRDGPAPSGLVRFGRDVAEKPGVRAVFVALGLNDIGWSGTIDSASPSVGDLQAAYRQLIAQARLRGVAVFAATLTPFEGAFAGTELAGFYSEEKEARRLAINDWLRQSRSFDGIVDFDAAVRDPVRPSRLLAAYDIGDHLHLNDAGYAAMAGAVPLDLLSVKEGRP